MKYLTLLLLLVAACADSSQPDIPTLKTGSQQPMPAEWIDADTGHRIRQVLDRQGDNRSFYFHNNPFLKTADGQQDLMVFYGDTEGGRQIFAVNVQTGEWKQLTTHPGRKHGEILAPKRREVFFQVRDTVFATSVDEGTTRQVFVFPDDFKAGISTINADETKLAGTWASPEKRKIYEDNPDKSDYFELIFEAHIPHTLFTIDLENGEIDKIHSENTWLGHIQFSPTDPDLLMFCHEGPWHKLDRIWQIDLQTKDIRKIHERTVDREIAGHEFFSPDGEIVWYDLQVPRGETFFLAGVELATGDSIRYQLERDEWSIHFNVSPDQTLFAGDGGDSTQVAHADNGRWIYLFRPENGELISEKLVNMENHGYRPLEPNVHFTPDGKEILFRSDLGGTMQIYAVSIEKAE